MVYNSNQNFNSNINNKISCIQLNLCRSKYSTTQLINFMDKNSIIIALIQEPYYYNKKVLTFSHQYEAIYTIKDNKPPKSAIIIRKSKISAIDIKSFSNDYITCVSISLQKRKILFISVYFAPKSDMNSELYYLKSIIDNIKPEFLVISADTNAHSKLWFDKRDDNRGQRLIDFINENKLIIINNNTNTPTYVSHQGKSSIDLTLINENLISIVSDWSLLDMDSMSDHKYITFKISDKPQEMKFKSTIKYNSKAGDWTSISTELTPIVSNLYDQLTHSKSCENIENIVKEMTDKIIEKCEKYMPKIKQNQNKKSNKWWSRELTEKRRTVCTARRRYERCQTENRKTLRNVYKTLESQYKQLIEETKLKSWRTFLADSSAENPWGLSYKIMKDKIFVPKLSEILDTDGNLVIDEKSIAKQLFDSLFPIDDVTLDNEKHKQMRLQSTLDSVGANDSPFSVNEVTDVVFAQNPKKSPGSDGLTADIIQNVHTINESFLTE